MCVDDVASIAVRPYPLHTCDHAPTPQDYTHTHDDAPRTSDLTHTHTQSHTHGHIPQRRRRIASILHALIARNTACNYVYVPRMTPASYEAI